MNKEMKPLDLRLSETLTHNLIRISDLVGHQSLALQIMSKVGKDVAPRWRMAFIKMIFNSDQGKILDLSGETLFFKTLFFQDYL